MKICYNEENEEFLRRHQVYRPFKMSAKLRNIKLVIAYDGTEFSGWQRQKHDRTIQGEIENCLNRMTREEINLHGAGRTDSGVHAEGMVAHFSTRSAISCHDFLRGLNSILPGAIRIYSAEDVDDKFHARFSAIGKKYLYVIYTGKVLPPHRRLYSLHVTTSLDHTTIRDCLKKLESRHDFASFENSGSRDKDNCSGRGAVRTIFKAEISREVPDLLIFEFIGDGFLRNMVRNLVGSVLEAGRGKMTVEEFGKVLEAKDRTKAGPTAPAHGLILKEVMYSPHSTSGLLSSPGEQRAFGSISSLPNAAPAVTAVSMETTDISSNRRR